MKVPLSKLAFTSAPHRETGGMEFYVIADCRPDGQSAQCKHLNHAATLTNRLLVRGITIHTMGIIPQIRCAKTASIFCR